MTTYSWGLTTPTPSSPPSYPVSALSAADKVLALVTDPFKDPQSLPVVFCTALALEIEEWKTAALQVAASFDLVTVTGVQLDRIGRILGKVRGSYTDDEYRAVLQAWILVLRSSGLFEQLNSIIELVLSAFSENTFIIEELPPKGLLVQIFDLLTVDPNLIFDLLQIAKQGGTSVQVSYTLSAAAATFTLGGTSAQGLGNGVLAGVIGE